VFIGTKKRSKFQQEGEKQAVSGDILQ